MTNDREFLKDDLVIYVPNHKINGMTASPTDLYNTFEGNSNSVSPFVNLFITGFEWMIVSSQNEGGVFCKPFHHRSGTSQRANRGNLLNISQMFRNPLRANEIKELETWYKLKGNKIVCMKKDAYEEVYDGLFDVDRFHEMQPLEVLETFNETIQTLHFSSFGLLTFAPLTKYIVLR